MNQNVRYLLAAVRACFLTVGLVGAPGSLIAAPLSHVDLITNRSLWESHGISDYDFVLSIGCFCEPEQVRPGIVSVRSDSITSVIDAQNHQPISQASFATVNNLFDRAQFALNSSEVQVDAQFDGILGFPRFLRIDDLLIGDDDITYTINSLTVVPEPNALLIAFPLLAIGITGMPRLLRSSSIG
jgi:hypothetical protein